MPSEVTPTEVLPPEISSLDETGLTVALSAASLQLRKIIIKEFTLFPEKYAELIQPEAFEASPALAAMEDIVDNLEHRKDIREKYERIDQLTRQQDARAEIFNQLYQSHDYRRFVNFLKARATVEKVILAVATKGDLDPAASLALLEYLGKEIGGMEKRISANSISGKDIAALLAKIDQVVDSSAEKMDAELKTSTPQNRELMRRVGYKLLKVVKQAKPKKKS